MLTHRSAAPRIKCSSYLESTLRSHFMCVFEVFHFEEKAHIDFNFAKLTK